MKKTLICILTVLSLLALLLSGCEALLGNVLPPIFENDPPSAEEMASAVNEYDDVTVYWTEQGTLAHLYVDCPHLNHSDVMCSGTVEQALNAGKTCVCAYCERQNSSELEETAPADPADFDEPSAGYRPEDCPPELRLVNKDYPLDASYSFDATMLASGAAVNRLCMDGLQEMFDDCRKAGYSPAIISGYVSYEEQEAAFEKRVSELTAIGYTQDDAESEAEKTVPRPGTSDYQTGLAVDIVPKGEQEKDAERLKDSDLLAWMRENSWKYGFVERYTEAQAKKYGVSYEPWHYRYVGRAAAAEMYASGECLEEYLLPYLPH